MLADEKTEYDYWVNGIKSWMKYVKDEEERKIQKEQDTILQAKIIKERERQDREEVERKQKEDHNRMLREQEERKIREQRELEEQSRRYSKTKYLLDVIKEIRKSKNVKPKNKKNR